MESNLGDDIWSGAFTSLRISIYHYSDVVSYRGEPDQYQRVYTIIRDRTFSKISRLMERDRDLLMLCRRMDSSFLEKWAQQMVQKEYALWKGEQQNEG